MKSAMKIESERHPKEKNSFQDEPTVLGFRKLARSRDLMLPVKISGKLPATPIIAAEELFSQQ